MARRLTTDPEIDQFISKVIGEANHHASQVEAIIQPLSDAVRSRLNLLIDRVEVYERNGKLARTCWVTVGGNRYVFTYDYQTFKIQLKDKGTQGTIRYQFDNSTTQANILQQVALL